MKNKRFAFQMIALSALAAAGPAAFANINLVQNGGFEITPGLTNSGQVDPTGTNVSGWSSSYIDSASGNLTYNFVYFPGQITTTLENAGGSGSTDPNGAYDVTDGGNPQVWLYGPNNGPTFPVSPSGGKFLAADADPSYRSTVNQTINGLTPGATYDLSFWWGGAQYTTLTGNTTEQWKVFLGNQEQDTAIISNNSKSFTGWQKASLMFTATSGTETLSFLADGTPGGEPPVAVLDGVSLSQTPEPGYWALLVVGLAGLVVVARRRSKSVNQSV